MSKALDKVSLTKKPGRIFGPDFVKSGLLLA